MPSLRAITRGIDIGNAGLHEAIYTKSTLGTCRDACGSTQFAIWLYPYCYENEICGCQEVLRTSYHEAAVVAPDGASVDSVTPRLRDSLALFLLVCQMKNRLSPVPVSVRLGQVTWTPRCTRASAISRPMYPAPTMMADLGFRCSKKWWNAKLPPSCGAEMRRQV